MKCNFCKNYMEGIDSCKFCHFEGDEFYMRDDWDILNLDNEEEWTHIQILNRLHSKGLPCIFADIWANNNLAFLVGCNVFSNKLAEVLGVHEECIYNEHDQAFVIINLYQEKCLRKEEAIKEDVNDAV